VDVTAGREVAGTRRAHPGTAIEVPGALGAGWVTSQGMDLEEHTLETAGDRCEECGAKLTQRELELVIESGGPALCTIHAAEVVPTSEEDAVDAEL
jgi:hypothetical protein